MTLYPESKRYGYKRLETDDEFRERCLQAWIARLGSRTDSFGSALTKATGEELDKAAWNLLLQRKIIGCY